MVKIDDILKKYWGYDEFRSLQREIILSVLEGKDTLALMPTGGGKSLTYQVAGMVLDGICLVVTPLIALMKDQVEDLRRRDIAAEAIHTGMDADEIASVINKCIYKGVKFLYVSPVRLTSGQFRLKLKEMPLSLIAVDEAHCISQWGYDFRPSYLRIAEIRDFFPGVAVLALTATATPEVVKDIQEQLKFKAAHVLSKSFRRDNLSYVVRKVEDKAGELRMILSRVNAPAIVYVRKRKKAEELADFLRKAGIRADHYHAGMSAVQREKRQEAWKTGEVPVIVATNAFGMGIDKADVRVVVHYDIPDTPESYFQEAGRAGRDGQRAYAVLLYNTASLTALKNRVEKEFPEKDYVKRVYEALGNHFQLGEGEGAGRVFEFDPDSFASCFELDQVKVLSAIGILSVAGYMECTTDINSRSRVRFLLLRDQLYDVDLGDELSERLMVVLMRSYAGIFVQDVYVDEEYIAGELNVDRYRLYHAFVVLAKQKILRYVPGNSRPYILYHQPRLPLSYLSIGCEAYEWRKQAYQKKVGAMVGYIELGETCRQLYLMAYFGQKEYKGCGICDVCIDRRKASVKLGKERIDQEILAELAKGDMDIKELVCSVPSDRDAVIARIRFLLDEDLIHYVTRTRLGLKR